MKVRAIKDFYTTDGALHKIGDEFEIQNFDPEYMEHVNDIKKSKIIKEVEDVSED